MPVYTPLFIPPVLHSSSDHIRQTPLLVTAHHILLHPAHRPEQPRPPDTQQRRQQLRGVHEHAQDAKRAHKLDKLVDLVEVVLRRDQIRGLGG